MTKDSFYKKYPSLEIYEVPKFGDFDFFWEIPENRLEEFIFMCTIHFFCTFFKRV